MIGKIGLRVESFDELQAVLAVNDVVDIGGLILVAVGEKRGDGVFGRARKRIFVAAHKDGKVVPAARVEVAREDLVRAGIGEHQLIDELHLRAPEQGPVGHGLARVVEMGVICRDLNAVDGDERARHHSRLDQRVGESQMLIGEGQKEGKATCHLVPRRGHYAVIFPEIITHRGREEIVIHRSRSERGDHLVARASASVPVHFLQARDVRARGVYLLARLVHHLLRRAARMQVVTHHGELDVAAHSRDARRDVVFVVLRHVFAGGKRKGEKYQKRG